MSGGQRIGVVGGGVIGLAAAHFLARKGATPVVIEADAVGQGCSAGNAGWVCMSISAPLPAPGLTLQSLMWMLRPDSPLYIKPTAIVKLRPWLTRFRAHCTQADFDHGLEALASLNVETQRLFAEIQTDGVDFAHEADGMLVVFRDMKKLEGVRAEMEATAALGVTRYDQVDEAGVYEREPSLRSGFKGGLFVHSDTHLRPETLTSGLAASLRRNGAEIHEGTRVTGFEVDGKTVRGLATTAGSMPVDSVVLAAGAESGRLIASCGMTIPLTAGKGYSVTIDRPRNQLRQPLYLGEAKIGLTPFEGALRLAGTMELSGINRQMDRKRVKSIRRAVYRDVDIPEAESGGTEWVGMRPLVPDTLPVIGKLPTRTNVYVSTAHQMLGVTLAPSSGWALAGLVVEGRSPVDLAPFSPARF